MVSFESQHLLIFIRISITFHLYLFIFSIDEDDFSYLGLNASKQWPKRARGNKKNLTLGFVTGLKEEMRLPLFCCFSFLKLPAIRVKVCFFSFSFFRFSFRFPHSFRMYCKLISYEMAYELTCLRIKRCLFSV